VCGLSEASWRVEWVSSVGISNADPSAWAELRLFGVRLRQYAEVCISHAGIAAVKVMAISAKF
jgi:hypothetical protein